MHMGGAWLEFMSTAWHEKCCLESTAYVECTEEVLCVRLGGSYALTLCVC